MEHIDPDELALHALGDTAGGDAPDRDALEAHLRECPDCAAELEALVSAVRIGRETIDTDRLVAPSPEVWTRIAAELDLAEDGAPTLDELAARRGRRTDEPAGERRGSGRSGRRLATFLAAAAAVLLVGTAGVLTWRLLTPTPAEVLASARLEALPDWSGSAGEATLERRADGALEVHVALDAPPAPGGYRELWLLNADATDLVSLGVLDGAEGTFTVPASVDLDVFDVVDISAEQADGDPGHSGDSIVRGALTS